jgi:hypothetical protein
MRAEESLKLSPTGKCNIVVCGDTFDGDTTEHFGKRSTNSAAFSVGKLQYVAPLGKPVNNDE